jgi:hypothetical protein
LLRTMREKACFIWPFERGGDRFNPPPPRVGNFLAHATSSRIFAMDPWKRVCSRTYELETTCVKLCRAVSQRTHVRKASRTCHRAGGVAPPWRAWPSKPFPQTATLPKSSEEIERCVIASFRVVESMGFKGEFRQTGGSAADWRLRTAARRS